MDAMDVDAQSSSPQETQPRGMKRKADDVPLADAAPQRIRVSSSQHCFRAVVLTGSRNLTRMLSIRLQQEKLSWLLFMP
jgi:hypothetical protein